MKSEQEISNDSRKTIYENREYYGMVLGRLIIRTIIITVLLIPFLLMMGALIIEAVEASSLLGIVALASLAVFALFFLYYLVVYKWTYKDIFIRTPKRVILDGETIYVETVNNRYEMDLNDIVMLGRTPYWRIKMKDGTLYEFYGVNHTITDPILATWKKRQKRETDARFQAILKQKEP